MKIQGTVTLRSIRNGGIQLDGIWKSRDKRSNFPLPEVNDIVELELNSSGYVIGWRNLSPQQQAPPVKLPPTQPPTTNNVVDAKNLIIEARNHLEAAVKLLEQVK